MRKSEIRNSKFEILIIITIVFVCAFSAMVFAAAGGLEDKVRATVKEYIVKKYPEWADKRIVIAFEKNDSSLKRVSQWGEVKSCEIVELSSALKPAGVVAIPLRFVDISGRQQISLVNTRVEIYDFAVVTQAKKRKGDILALKDLKLEERDVSLLGSRYFSDGLGVSGLMVTTSIPQDVIIQPWMVKMAPLVPKGGKVTILFHTQNVGVGVVGHVLDDAYLGQAIKVRREGQKKAYEGTVVGSREVEVII
ncbi:MAG: flagellar basal body P-ring formation chaperone FlgA [Candidatus Saganbacteria bacterium]|nr:flagellar basal body P-ring formation chaperone FlgA [Candidatus Saganbacteria bacterium]